MQWFELTPEEQSDVEQSYHENYDPEPLEIEREEARDIAADLVGDWGGGLDNLVVGCMDRYARARREGDPRPGLVQEELERILAGWRGGANV